MFFIVPQAPPPGSPEDSSSRSSPHSLRTNAPDDAVACYYPKRTPRACDRCRLKKARCSVIRGACIKCKRDGVVCVTSAPTKPDSKIKNPEYVHMVEGQRDLLVQALHKIWKTSRSGSANAEQELNTILEEIDANQIDIRSKTTSGADEMLRDAVMSGNTNGDSGSHSTGMSTTSTSVQDNLNFGESFNFSALPSTPDQRDDPVPTYAPSAFETWCPEWFQSSLDAMPAFNETLDPTTAQNMAQSPQLTWENWLEFCGQDVPKGG
jgi:Fungal Zn(2)-Cys(6) binuclear cluster domain